ncbi:MAG: hypothetical protein QXN59_01245 [Candidatus Micrarchaeaceae archaeon]
MASSDTFTLGRQELRRILIAFGVSEKNITAIIASMEKSHRHVNLLSFISMLEKAGLDRDNVSNILRRIGLSDLTINQALNAIDEQRINSEVGRVYEAVIDLGGV